MTRRRTVVLIIIAILLLAAAVVGLVTGVQTRVTTGGLLVSPVEEVHLVGGRLLAATAAGVAAVLVALAAWAHRRRDADAGDRRA
jgi:hypothetical protein